MVDLEDATSSMETVLAPALGSDLELEDNEEQTRSVSLADAHCEKVVDKCAKGRNKGMDLLHFKCNYCNLKFQGPSNSSFLKHLRRNHPKKCPELNQGNTKPKRDFFNSVKMKLPFDADIFVGKLLTWIIKTDQSFSTVDNEYFQSMLD